MPSGIDVSSTDLLQTHLASMTGSGSYYSAPWNVPSRLTNGDFGNFGGEGSESVMPAAAGLTYRLNTAASPAGYSISRIRTFASWDSGRDGQSYAVKYSLVSEPTTFFTLKRIARFDSSGFPIAGYHPQYDENGDEVWDQNGPVPDLSNPYYDEQFANTTVELTTDSGAMVTNVAALRFVFDGYANGGTAYREIDVFGAPVPFTPPVTANAGPDQRVGEGRTVTLDGTGSRVRPSLLAFTWTQQSGPSVQLSNRHAVSPTFMAPDVSLDGAVLEFELSVIDGQLTAADTVTITVENINKPPVANVGPNQTLHTGTTVYLNGTGSFDDNTEVAFLQYSWSFAQVPAGNTAVLSNANTAKPGFTPNVVGDYVVQLIVTDG